MSTFYYNYVDIIVIDFVVKIMSSTGEILSTEETSATLSNAEPLCARA